MLYIIKGETKVMIVDKLAHVTCNLSAINIVDYYMYLGSQICNDGSCVLDIKR